MIAADNFLDILKEVIREEINKTDQTELCKIISINEEGTYNLCVFPDLNTEFKNIINASKYTFAVGDIAILYKRKNNVANSFIIAKYNPGEWQENFNAKQINGQGVSDIFEENGLTVKNASNVTNSIGGKLLEDIFESNGTTVKKSIYSQQTEYTSFTLGEWFSGQNYSLEPEGKYFCTFFFLNKFYNCFLYLRNLGESIIDLLTLMLTESDSVNFYAEKTQEGNYILQGKINNNIDIWNSEQGLFDLQLLQIK